MAAEPRAVQGIDFNLDRLAGTHGERLGLLVVGDDPELLRHQVQQLRAGRHVLALAHRDLADLPVARCVNYRIVQIDLRALERRLCDFYLCLQPAA